MRDCIFVKVGERWGHVDTGTDVTITGIATNAETETGMVLYRDPCYTETRAVDLGRFVCLYNPRG